jgi:DNA-binding MarR family transcriptional regulator
MPAADQFESIMIQWNQVAMRNSMRNFFQYLKQRGLSMTQMSALFCVFRKGNCAISDIGEELGITNAAASQMLERLVQQGLILRSEDPTDRRMKQIVLTDQGRQVLEESISARQSWVGNLAGVLSAGEKEQVVAALQILLEKAQMLRINQN